MLELEFFLKDRQNMQEIHNDFCIVSPIQTHDIPDAWQSWLCEGGVSARDKLFYECMAEMQADAEKEKVERWNYKPEPEPEDDSAPW